MFFIATIILLVLGVFLLRRQKIVAGYATLALGWMVAIVADILTSKSWDAGFITFFIGLAFIWFVQKKMSVSKHTQ